jgi:Rieske Fe-S protein
MVIGAGVEHVAEQVANGNRAGSGIPTTPPALNIQEGAPTTWHFVTTVAQLGDDAVRFVTDTVVGYVIFGDEDADPPDRGKIIAMSAACTHMGCIVQWQSSKHRFSCPCHEGLFSEYGKIDPSQGPKYLSPLPRLETKVEDGKIFVKVPIDRGVIG